MANELTALCDLRFVKDGVVVEMAGGGRLTISGTKFTKIIQEIGTSEEALDVGDLGASPGYILIKNLDATNYVEIRPGSGVADLIKIRPGLPALFELAMATPYAIADTAACKVEFLIIEQ